MSEFNFENVIGNLPAEMATRARHIDAMSGDGLVRFDQVISDITRHMFSYYASQEVGLLHLNQHYGDIYVAANMRSAPTDVPPMLYMTMRNNDDALLCVSAIQRDRRSGTPFVGYIETIANRREGHAKRMIGVMHHLSHAIYNQPITAGPDSLISDHGIDLKNYFERRKSTTSTV